MVAPPLSSRSAARCSGCESRPRRLIPGVGVDVDVVADGAVDVSATFVDHVDDSTVIIFVNIATTASKSSIPRS